jgi:hypothetical protein
MSSIDRSRPPAERRSIYALGQAKYKEGAYELAIEQFTKVCHDNCLLLRKD